MNPNNQIGRKPIPEHPYVTAAQGAYSQMPYKLALQSADFIFQQGFIQGIKFLQAAYRAEQTIKDTPTLILQKENDVAGI